MGIPSPSPQLVTKSDTLELTYNGEPAKTKYISIGTAGNLAIKDSLGNTVIIPANALEVGTLHPIATGKILSTGTAAAEIVAWF